MGYNSPSPPPPPPLDPSQFIIDTIESETLTFSLKNQKGTPQHTCADHICKHAMYVGGRIRHYGIRQPAACLTTQSQLQLSDIVLPETLLVSLV